MGQAGYKYLKSYQLSVIVYDLTVEFCRRWIRSRRTTEQMEQAARSGKQNKLELWNKEDLRIREFRGFRVFGDSPEIPELPENPETAANFLLTLCHQTQFLLFRQTSALEEKFVKEGGYTENLFKKRMEERRKK